MPFVEGDGVLARNPGSSKYRRAVIVEGEEYTVQYEDGSTSVLSESYIEPLRVLRRSVTRGETTKKDSSPARQSKRQSRSPARSPSRAGSSKSRERRGRSPGQLTVDLDQPRTTRTKRKSARSRSREEREGLSRVSSTTADEQHAEVVHPVVMEYIHSEMSSVTLRTRTAANEDVEVSAEEMDEEDLLAKLTEWRETKLPVEFGGCLGALFLIVMLPGTVLGLHLYSSMIDRGLPISTDWRSYFDIEVVTIYTVFITVLSLLSLLPLGKLVEGLPDKLGKRHYRCNGFLVCLLTLIGIGLVHFYWYPVTVIFNKYIQFLVTGILYGILVAIILFYRGGKVSIAALNMFGCSENIIYDFWIGREVSPRLWRWDLKTTLLKISLITNVVLYEIIILKSIESEANWNVSLLVTVAMQAFYTLQCLWFEEFMPTTFHVLYEGSGYMLTVGCNLYPFITTILTKYLLEQRVEFSLCVVPFICIMKCVGYHIYISSNMQKYKFRTNPVNPISDPLSIPTLRGKKLLASGWWGFVRHPNYLGDILMHWAWIGTFGLTHWLPYTVPVFTTVLLLHRAKRDEARCRHRYGMAYDLYCDKVKASVIPRVF